MLMNHEEAQFFILVDTILRLQIENDHWQKTTTHTYIYTVCKYVHSSYTYVVKRFVLFISQKVKKMQIILKEISELHFTPNYLMGMKKCI